MISKKILSFVILLPIIAFANVQITPTTFNHLPGWRQNNFTKSFSTLKRSCRAILRHKLDGDYGTLIFALRKKQFKVLCLKAYALKKPSKAQAKRFFEKNFKPVAITDNGNPNGLFTGYYLPTIPGSKVKTNAYSVPIYSRPKNLITVDLGMFRHNLKGKKIAGYINKRNRLFPYNVSRYQINRGALKNKAKIVIWTKTRADRFFLQIQGSGMVVLPHGKKILLGYDGATNEAYYPIGRWLMQKKYISMKNMSLQSIHHWLRNHPKSGRRLMNRNKSFVFFKILQGNDVYGTDKIPLTPRYSLAVDNSIIPLGLPVWLSTRLPTAKNANKSKTFNRLMIAQDTGGAIHGAVRGDVYLGLGRNAAIIAGHMKHQGRFWVLIPKAAQR